MNFPKKTINLYWFNKDRNFGDQLNPYLISRLFNVHVKWASPTASGKKYFAIGSILSKATSSSSVWGSGLISSNSSISSKPIIHAVRGPMTHRKLSSLGISSPKVFGDPALLLPHVYFPKIEKKFEIGIIPHYVDKNHSAIKKESQNKNIKIIDVQNKNIEQTICDIISCEIILSSSLHGLIVADAYSIPNFWIKMSNRIIGGNFKFHDYFLSVSRDLIEPAVIGSSFNFNKIIENNPFKTPKIDLTPLLKSNPFL